MRRVLFIATLAALATASALGVATGATASSAPTQTVVSFDATAGELPEGLAVDENGSLYVSLSPLGQIRRIAADGSQSVLATIGAGAGLGPLGLAVGASGHVYAAVATFDSASSGVYWIPRRGMTKRLPGTGQILFPNAVALDTHGSVYATDTIAGAVWRVPPGGSAELWIQHPLLVGDGSAGFGFPVGANGIAYRHGSFYVANSERGRIVRIPVRRDGKAGAPQVVAENPALVPADGIAFDVLGNLYVAVIAQNTLVRVASDGSIETLATAADGLDFPASLAFGTTSEERKELFFTNFGILGTPSVLKLNVGVPGRRLP